MKFWNKWHRGADLKWSDWSWFYYECTKVSLVLLFSISQWSSLHRCGGRKKKLLHHYLLIMEQTYFYTTFLSRTATLLYSRHRCTNCKVSHRHLTHWFIHILAPMCTLKYAHFPPLIITLKNSMLVLSHAISLLKCAARNHMLRVTHSFISVLFAFSFCD